MKKGSHHTAESKQKTSASLRGHPSYTLGMHFNKETKQKMSLAHKGRCPHAFTEKSRERMRLSHLGKGQSEETKRKIGLAMKGHIGAMRGKRHSEEVKRKIGSALSGDKHWNWQGGKSFEPYTPEFNKQLKALIRDRDGYRCQLCSISEFKLERKLRSHHIDYNKENCLPDNLIALCRDCNMKVNTNREYWTKYFQEYQRERGIV